MRQQKSNTASTVSPWKPNVSWTYSTVTWRPTPICQVTNTPSPIWRSGPGTANLCSAASTALANSSMSAPTPTCSAGPKQIDARPAVKRGRMVNRTFGEPATQLHERHDASDFDTKTKINSQKKPDRRAGTNAKVAGVGAIKVVGWVSAATARQAVFIFIRAQPNVLEFCKTQPRPHTASNAFANSSTTRLSTSLPCAVARMRVPLIRASIPCPTSASITPRVGITPPISVQRARSNPSTNRSPISSASSAPSRD